MKTIGKIITFSLFILLISVNSAHAVEIFGVDNNNIPSRLYKIDPNTGSSILFADIQGRWVFDITFGPDGFLYGSDVLDASPEGLVKIDPDTGEILSFKPYTGDLIGCNSVDEMAFDNEGNLYLVQQAMLSTVDINTGEVTWLGNITYEDSYHDITAIDFSPDGTLYATTRPVNTCYPYHLLTIDLVTLTATLVGETSDGVNAMGFTADGTLYAVDDCHDRLITIDPNTGDYQRIGFLVSYPSLSICGLAVRPSTSPESQSPVADAGPDQAIFDEVTLDGIGSYDPDGTIESYEWLLHHRESSTDTFPEGVNPVVSDLAYGFYDVTLTVTDDEGLTDTDTMLLAAAGPCVCVASTMHVESIVAKTKKGKYGKVKVTIFDNLGNPVPGAEVTGTFSGDFDEEGSGVTNRNGVTKILTTAKVNKPTYTFCVDNVIKEALTYEPNDNVETCESK